MGCLRKSRENKNETKAKGDDRKWREALEPAKPLRQTEADSKGWAAVGEAKGRKGGPGEGSGYTPADVGDDIHWVVGSADQGSAPGVCDTRRQALKDLVPYAGSYCDLIPEISPWWIPDKGVTEIGEEKKFFHLFIQLQPKAEVVLSRAETFGCVCRGKLDPGGRRYGRQKGVSSRIVKEKNPPFQGKVANSGGE